MGRFLRTFTFGHVRQLDAVASRLLIGLSGSAPLLAGAGQLAYLDVDDTVKPTFGYAKHGAGRGYTGVKGPIPAGQAEICARGRPSVGTSQRELLAEAPPSGRWYDHCHICGRPEEVPSRVSPPDPKAIMDSSLGRRCAAEFLGTALLIVFGPGSVVAALKVGKGSLDYAGLGMISLSFGLVVAIVIYGFGTTSGAHINPAVSFVLAATGRFPWSEVVPYAVAQLVGSVVGGLVIVATFGTGAVELGNVGGVAFGDGVGYPQAIAVEAVATFLLVFTIFALAVDRRAPAGWAGWMIGLSVTALVLVFGPLTGAAVNPARALGPNAAAALFGGSVAWSQYPAYVLGSLLGGLAAGFSYDLIARPDRAAPEPEPAVQGTQGEVVGSRV